MRRLAIHRPGRQVRLISGERKDSRRPEIDEKSLTVKRTAPLPGASPSIARPPLERVNSLSARRRRAMTPANRISAAMR